MDENKLAYVLSQEKEDPFKYLWIDFQEEEKLLKDKEEGETMKVEHEVREKTKGPSSCLHIDLYLYLNGLVCKQCGYVDEDPSHHWKFICPKMMSKAVMMA